ncbi:hypothetical protein [Paenibacillus campinasensis]|uniref:Uncharacterized protein n=1 Tax=Paenibacillus campinasensis TaxID=66347 RepID=A0A268EH04_9BACL|nr:hypothetical protein [Paenibacillus campinasensis]PAD72408.1 hypothetical protein CHH67_22470 [Paenibacillus campinasensis]
MKISVTQHAIDAAISRFRVDRRIAEEWIRSGFRQARFVADIISEEGNPCRLFAGKHVTFILDAREDRVVTIYPSEVRALSVREKVESIINRELRKIERKESATVKRNHLSRLELNVERAACLLRAEKSRSQSVKLAMQARIAAIDEYLTQLNEDIEKIRHEKRKIAKAVAAYVV